MEPVERQYYIAKALFTSIPARYFIGYWDGFAFIIVELFKPTDPERWVAAPVGSTDADGLTSKNFHARCAKFFLVGCTVSLVEDKALLPSFGIVDFDFYNIQTYKKNVEAVISCLPDSRLMIREPTWNL